MSCPVLLHNSGLKSLDSVTWCATARYCVWLSVRAWLQQHKEDMTLHNVCFFNVSICHFVHFIRSCTFMLKVAVLPRLMSRNVEEHITTSIPWKRDLDYMSHFLCFRIDTIIIIFYRSLQLPNYRYLIISIWIDICSLTLLDSWTEIVILPIQSCFFCLYNFTLTPRLQLWY